jgi:hypothetical protein
LQEGGPQQQQDAHRRQPDNAFNCGEDSHTPSSMQTPGPRTGSSRRRQETKSRFVRVLASAGRVVARRRRFRALPMSYASPQLSAFPQPQLVVFAGPWTTSLVEK